MAIKLISFHHIKIVGFILLLLAIIVVYQYITAKNNTIEVNTLKANAYDSQPKLLSLYLNSYLPVQKDVEVLIAHNNPNLIMAANLDSPIFFESYSLYHDYCLIDILFDVDKNILNQSSIFFDFCDKIVLESHIASGFERDYSTYFIDNRSIVNATLFSSYTFKEHADVISAYNEVESYYDNLSNILLFHTPLEQTYSVNNSVGQIGRYLVTKDDTYNVQIGLGVSNNTLYHIKIVSEERTASVDFSKLEIPLGREYLHRLNTWSINNNHSESRNSRVIYRDE